MDGNLLYQLQNNGNIYRYETVSHTWTLFDSDPFTVSITASGGEVISSTGPSLWKLRSNGEVLEYTPGAAAIGQPWRLEDLLNGTIAIVADVGNLYQLRPDGTIWNYVGAPTPSPTTGWKLIDAAVDAGQPRTKMIAAGGTYIDATGTYHHGKVYKLLDNGEIWAWNITDGAWHRLDNNPFTAVIWVQDGWLFQVHSDGTIWRFTSNESWVSVDLDTLIPNLMNSGAGISLTTPGGGSPAPTKAEVQAAVTTILTNGTIIIAAGAAVAGAVGISAAVVGTAAAGAAAATAIALTVVGAGLAIATLATQPDGSDTLPTQIGQPSPTPGQPSGAVSPPPAQSGGEVGQQGHPGSGGEVSTGQDDHPVNSGDDQPDDQQIDHPSGEGEQHGDDEDGGVDLVDSPGRVRWLGTTFYEWMASHANWWTEWDNNTPRTLIRTFQEIGRDTKFIYLKDKTPNSNLLIALGYTRRYYHYTDGQPSWHADTPGSWQT